MTGPDDVSPCWHRAELHTPEDMQRALGQVLVELRRLGYGEKEMFGIRLALEEAISNSIRHGHRNDPGKTVWLRYQLSPQAFTAEVQDEGPGFDPAAIPDPLAPENLERPGGRGVFLMRHYMTAVRYNDRGNCVTLAKCRAPAGPPEFRNGADGHHPEPARGAAAPDRSR